ncbi:MAG: hypothetical protein CMJ94_01155 [Planctomycetes bacterium]|nr:hypothetical protein [Planctomycetota bacterium]
MADHSWSKAVDADPAKIHARLSSASADWEASLVIDNDKTGIWTVKPFSFFPQYATQELFGLDDLGRCWVLVSYSGKWTPFPILRDGVWLGALAQGEADPRVAGPEVYTGGAAGRLYQLRAYHDGGLDARRIAAFPGKELHTVVAGEFDPRNDSPEVLVFTRPGAWYRVSPTGEHGEWVSEELGPLQARIRDALVLSADESGRSPIITAARDGAIRELRFDAGGPQWSLIHQVGQGRGRLAAGSDGRVVYSTADDGRVFRHERTASGWQTELVYSGSHGPRGLAAGRFHPDPQQECLALFGYSGRVELLTRAPGQAWQTEVLFVDRDKGHWLCAGEFDGRNNTLEIFASGYGGRIVMLSRGAD